MNFGLLHHATLASTRLGLPNQQKVSTKCSGFVCACVSMCHESWPLETIKLSDFMEVDCCQSLQLSPLLTSIVKHRANTSNTVDCQWLRAMLKLQPVSQRPQKLRPQLVFFIFFYPASTESWLRFDEVPWFTQAKRDRETRSDCVDVACIVVILMKELRRFNLFWWTPCPPNKYYSNSKHIPADKAVLAIDK